jgi:methionyl-tRNA synthetase
MKNTGKFYVTSPIFYPNAEPHLGHAYVTLLCDVLKRFYRDQGNETYFVTGTDEHTEKVMKAAKAQEQAPDTYLEKIVDRFKQLYSQLNISYDQFIRTSDKEVHWPGAEEMWNRLMKAGTLEKRPYAGLYCVGCESFKTDKDLVNGLCPDHAMAPEEITEQNWFFKLKTFGPQLKSLIEKGELKIVPDSRKNEILSFIDSGLEDVSFSRPKEKMFWGIPVPGDSEQTMYIWVDALTSYLTALGFGRDERLMDFWPGTHIIGKDILRFHAVFWPAMLITAGLPLPETIFVHGTIISGGRKMSKSIGNVISPYELVAKYGTEATRYLLLRHVHPFDDTDVTWERLDEWYTANLVNGLGNLVARVMKMSEEYQVSPPDNVHAPAEKSVLGFEFNKALDAVWERVRQLDEAIQNEEPFKKIKTDKETAHVIIRGLVGGLKNIADSLAPFMPETSAKISDAVKTNKKPENLFPRLV